MYKTKTQKKHKILKQLLFDTRVKAFSHLCLDNLVSSVATPNINVCNGVHLSISAAGWRFKTLEVGGINIFRLA